MDRIQNAIAKARATREGNAVDTPAGASSKTASQDAWSEIPLVDLQPKHLTRYHILTNEASQKAIPFDILRTRTLQRLSEKGWSRMAITSPTPGCGKSTTIANLALSIARKSDYRIVVLETDMRRPSLSRIFGVQGRKDLSTVLTGRADFAEAAIRVSPNLALVTQNTTIRESGDILLGSHVAPLLKELEEVYHADLILFDTPPLLMQDDTTAVLQHTDCALLMAEADQTSIKEIDVCEKEIASYTNVMGVVMNKCRHMPQTYNEYP